MKNQHLQKLYDAMPRLFLKALGGSGDSYVDYLCKKYQGQNQIELDEDDIDEIELYCHKNLSCYAYDEESEDFVDYETTEPFWSPKEWNEFINYTFEFIKNTVIEKLNK